MGRPSRALSLSDWAVLGVVAEGPTHGWPVARELSKDGALGAVWTVTRPQVYRSFGLLAELGYVEERELTQGSGPPRTVVRVTRSGRAALRRWLDAPVGHIRDVRTEFLLKVALLDRSGRDWHELAARQLAQLGPVFSALDEPASDRGFDAVLARWKQGQADAVETFLQSLARRRTR
ncbi:MAG TPA: PadR family transcriptional regulator [Acidimicrobiia bacterium]|nr:PadR family transcriptional regulator [Acidimicrobiia bacterium]